MYKELLESEIKKSGEYMKSDFGRMIGEGYTELCSEVLKSEGVANVLAMNVAFVGLMLPSISDSAKKASANGEKDAISIVRENQAVFSPFLDMFYWGIQVGRQIEKQNKEVLDLEKMVGL